MRLKLFRDKDNCNLRTYFEYKHTLYEGNIFGKKYFLVIYWVKLISLDLQFRTGKKTSSIVTLDGQVLTSFMIILLKTYSL